jgi:molybdenum cofactor guanylyltransferase
MIPGAILAGGQSRRMGVDKAFLEVDGKPLIRHSLEVLREVCSEVVIIGGNGEKFSRFGLAWHPDAVMDCGPLGGIYTALSLLKDDVVMMACDLPRVTPELLRFLISHHRQSKAQITVPEAGKRVQPLVGVYNPSCLPLLDHFLERGERRVLHFLRECRTVAVSIESAVPPFPLDTLLNVNTPQEYQSSARS